MSFQTEFEQVYAPYLSEELAAKIRGIFANRLTEDDGFAGKTLDHISVADDCIFMRFDDGTWFCMSKDNDPSGFLVESIEPDTVDFLAYLWFLNGDEAAAMNAAKDSFRKALDSQRKEQDAIEAIEMLYSMGYTVIPPTPKEEAK